MNLAYIAGFVDGEGCIGFCRLRTYVFPRVLVTNTDFDILEDLQAKFGGDIKPLSLRKANWKQGYTWRLSNMRAVDFLDAIRPWLRIKDRQADTVFCWAAVRPGKGKRPDRDATSLLVEHMTWLNRKGVNIEQSPMERALQ
jgi:hypothetical protein